jgi:hypothetical protein
LGHLATNNSGATPGQPENQLTESVALRVRVPEEQYEMVRDFLLRRNALQPSVRTRLANLLSRRISLLLEQPVPPEEQSESFLEYVVRNYEL